MMASCDILVQGWRISRTAYAAGSSRGELFWSDSLESPPGVSFAALLPRPPSWHRGRPAPCDRRPWNWAAVGSHPPPPPSSACPPHLPTPPPQPAAPPPPLTPHL